MKKIIVTLVLLLLFSITGFATGGVEATTTLVYGTTEKVTDMDPAHAYDFHTWEIFQNILHFSIPQTIQNLKGKKERFTLIID